MTHSFDEICKLDSERTQGDWEFHDGGRKNDWSESSWVQIPEHFDDNGNDSDDVIYLRLTANAQYIAAMPDAVGLLRKFHDGLEAALNALQNAKYSLIDAEDFDSANEVSNTADKLQQLLQEPKP